MYSGFTFRSNIPYAVQRKLILCAYIHLYLKNKVARVREVEHATFVPLVMSATGGLAKQATNFYKRLASLLADKWMQPYSTTLYWLRCSLSFSLLRSAIQCIRGARSSRGHAVKLSPVDLVTAEALRPDPFHHPVHARSED